MAVARAQICAISKRLFSGISIPHPPPHCVSSLQITDDKNDKFSFLDGVGDLPWPPSEIQRWHVFIKKSCLKGATDEEKMDFYVKTAAKVYGSKEEAKKRIYKVTRDCSFDGFGFEMCWNGTRAVAGLESVESVSSEYAGPMYLNGEIVRWSLIPKRREKGRFPLPNPDLPTDDSGSDTDYD